MAGARGNGDRTLKPWLRHSGRLVLTVVVTWFILDRVGLGLDELRAIELAAWRPNLLWLTASSVLLLGMYFASALLWGRIVTEMGGPSLPSAVAIRVFMIANLGRYLPGKVWQIAGLAALAKGRGVPAATAMGAAVLAQGLQIAAATTIGFGALLVAPEPYRRLGLIGAAVAAAAILAASLPPVFRQVADWWFRLSRTEPPAELRAVHGMRWLILSLLIWSGYALSFWLLVTSFGASVPIVATGSAFAAAYVVGYLAFFAPAGGGVREGVLIAILTPSFGVASATALSVIARLWTTAVEVVPAGVMWATHVRDVEAAADE